MPKKPPTHSFLAIIPLYLQKTWIIMNFKLFACLVAVIEHIYTNINKKCDETLYWLELGGWKDLTINLLTNDKSNHVKYHKGIADGIGCMTNVNIYSAE